MTYLTAGLCVLGVLGGATSAVAESPRELRVMAYNIHHGEGTDGRVDLERIARVIAAESPHLVALNEVDRGTRRTRRLDMPAELARLTGMTAVFEKNIDYDGGQYGNAVLSRLPIRRHANHPLPSQYDGEQRGVLEVEVELGEPGDEETLLFFATHLDYRPDDGERLASVGRFEELLGDRPERLAILAGDLNATPDSPVLAALARHWTNAVRQPLPTYPAAEPTKQIDYILVRPTARWKLVESRVLPAPKESDHRPIASVLQRLAATATGATTN